MSKEELNKEIGGRIRKHREFLGLTREELSEKANISTQFLADIEMGRKSMTASTIIGLSCSLHITSDYILFGDKANKNADHTELAQILDGLSTAEYEGAINILKAYIITLSMLY